jgi:hypothetical protein
MKVTFGRKSYLDEKFFESIVEIQKHTTLQYRAPEMIDLYQQKLISEKVDIWVSLLPSPLLSLTSICRLLDVYYTNWHFIRHLLRRLIRYKF